MDADPRFVAPNTTATANFDATLYDFSLGGDSPATNVGSNALIGPEYPLDLSLLDLRRVNRRALSLLTNLCRVCSLNLSGRTCCPMPILVGHPSLKLAY